MDFAFDENQSKTIINTVNQSRDPNYIDELIEKAGTPEGIELANIEIRRNAGSVYGTDPARPGFIVERRPDGTKRFGKIVNRHFVVDGNI